MATPTKRKSQMRFEQVNQVVDVIAPTLPNASYVAVLLVCWRHADVEGKFRIDQERIAECVRLSTRQVKRILKDLVCGGVLRLVERHRQHTPPRYKITGKPFRGDTHVTPEENKRNPEVTPTSPIQTYRHIALFSHGAIGLCETTQKDLTMRIGLLRLASDKNSLKGSILDSIILNRGDCIFVKRVQNSARYELYVLNTRKADMSQATLAAFHVSSEIPQWEAIETDLPNASTK